MSISVGRVSRVVVLVLACVGVASLASADARSDYLVRLLRSSTQFRVRAQAAISLGRVEGESGVVAALGTALSDRHPAVRAAAASSLERLGDPDALEALRERSQDQHAEVRSAVSSAIEALERVVARRERTPVRRSTTPDSTQAGSLPSGGRGGTYYVGVGVPGSRVGGLGDAELEAARAFLRGRIAAVPGVELAPESERPAQAEAVLRRRRLTGYYIDSSIVSVDVRADGGIRAAVSVIVGTYPGRDMRSILQGAATVMGGGAGAREQAIEAAFTGALRNLPQAMAAGQR